jgi:hypothetical protein
MSKDVGVVATSHLNHKSKRETTMGEVVHLGAYRSTCDYYKMIFHTNVAQGV